MEVSILKGCPNVLVYIQFYDYYPALVVEHNSRIQGSKAQV